MKRGVLVTLGGKPFSIRMVPQSQISDDNETDLGECSVSRQEILINRDQDGQLLMETLIHECLHGCMDYLTEDTVSNAGREIAAILYQFGYRRER